MTFNARERFRNSPHAKTWQDVCDSAQFQEAATAAMTALSSTTPGADQMEGAWLFLEILMNLTAPVPPSTAPASDNLDHNA